MSFVEQFRTLPLADLEHTARAADRRAVGASLGKDALTLADFATLLSPSAQADLERMCHRSQAMTRQRFGRVIRMFAPLYLSNECINNCKYCGFSRDNPILRVTLDIPQVLREAEALKDQGFRHLLLVAGEHPKFVSNGYLEECIRALRPMFPSISLEVGPMEAHDYRPLVEAGSEGLVVYQETYDEAVYADMHTAGPKRNFEWRLETPERAYQAGFRRLGLGALYGLADWRREAICVAAHAAYLLRHCWKAYLTVSVPRLRPCAGSFQPQVHLSDREIVQLVCAFRMFLPDVGLVLSTREPAALRDGLFPLGITLISAGSHTEPGGYTGAGSENVHQTVRGRIQANAGGATVTGTDSRSASQGNTLATGQFEIADNRSAAEVSGVLRRLGYEPVWKDWDTALSA